MSHTVLEQSLDGKLITILTFDHVILGDSLSPGHSVCGNVLDSFLEHGPDPHADVCCHDVHETEPSETFELVNVELKNKGNVNSFFCT